MRYWYLWNFNLIAAEGCAEFLIGDFDFKENNCIKIGKKTPSIYRSLMG